MCPDADTDREDRFADAIGGALQYAANEAVVLARLEEFLSPKPAQLATDENAVKSLNDLADRVTALYGGAPRLGSGKFSISRSLPLGSTSETAFQPS
jgi:hypothetical protein